MANNHVIEIDGCKISPEFVELVNKHFNTVHASADNIKSTLFEAQLGILSGIADSNIVPANLDRVISGIQSLYYFFDELEDLHKQGKF